MAEHSHHGALDNFTLDAGLHSKVRTIITFLLLISGAAMAAGYFMDHKQFFHSYLAGFAWSTRILLGALFFLMAMYMAGAAWNVTVRRFQETLAASIPFGVILFIPLIFGVHDLYEWSHAEVVANDPILQGKAVWLNEKMFVIKSLVYFGIWSIFALGIYKNSTSQDKDKDIRHMHSSARYSAPGLLVVFLATSFAAMDWIMSLNPHWYSTIYGIYIYAGGAWLPCAPSC